MKRPNRALRLGVAVVLGLLALGAAVIPTLAAPPVKGALFTTDDSCVQVNGNIYADKLLVFINGGPKKPGAAGLPDGDYYVKVTSPNGKLLGTSIGAADETPVHVTGGEFDQCLNLYSILVRASDGSTGYDDTPNPGGEYKAWVSNEPTFANNSSKTDNFKVEPGEISPGPF
jgi:hypothetical protein